MTFAQIFVLGLLVAVFGLFVWGRLRHDVVAILALLAATAAGTVPAGEMFAGFASPATVTVALVLVASRGLVNSGAVDLITRHLPTPAPPTAHVGLMSSIGGALSSFMNNVGALALLMPAALQSAARVGRSPAVLLMPLAFGSILGGMVTLIGTPPNIIIASFRQELTGTPFSMFDYSPVGGVIALMGIAYIALVGWRLIPRSGEARTTADKLFDIENYITEAEIPDGHALCGKMLLELDEVVTEYDANILGVLRGDHRIDPAMRRTHMRAGDILLIEAAPEALSGVLGALDLSPPGAKSDEESAPAGPDGEIGADEGARRSLFGGPDVAISEAVVRPGSRLAGRTPTELRLRSRYGVNLLAVAREGRPFRGGLRAFRFRGGDVLLLEGDPERLPEVINTIGCLPLADRNLQLARDGTPWIAIGLFAAAIAATTLGLASFPAALAAAVVGMVLLNIVPVRELYDGIDWSIVVLLGAMIPIGTAMQDTGATLLIADTLTGLVADYSPVVGLVVILVVTMTLSDVINNAATAVVMAPISASMATSLGVNPDTFLMAVAIGASCAFLTPIGHQNNALVMGPGGYHFSDYWHMGLPLEILIVAVGTPMLLLVWPLT
ncbi:MAG: SLC13 family permease [Alphaproteobacteria bacterium]